MSVQQRIETKLGELFHPLHCEVVNESYRHSVPPNSESHFRVTLVSEAFEGRRAERDPQNGQAVFKPFTVTVNITYTDLVTNTVKAVPAITFNCV